MKNSRGFIALISILILSVVMLAAVVSLAQFGVTTRYALLDLERKAETESLALACVELVRIAVVNNPNFTATNLSVDVGTTTKRCLIESVASGVVRASATSGTAKTNIRATLNTTSGNVTRLEELATM